ncbi:HPr family phosphocarrier protein [Microbacterium tenebrionis]|uniref:HPr family phosphocarrier protein n=1 Tax=Microbacterium tenebrionis TaxID=2830665 RepID=UPI001C3764EF|nr:HPr family phosphocarrier protein [Microbacterium ihumii]
MPTRRVTITAAHGAHARPVAELVRLALEHPAPVYLTTPDGSVVDLSSVLSVMELGLAEGDEVVLGTASSPDAESVLDAMAGVLAPRG